jgi:hypothetical protein
MWPKHFRGIAIGAEVGQTSARWALRLARMSWGGPTRATAISLPTHIDVPGVGYRADGRIVKSTVVVN